MSDFWALTSSYPELGVLYIMHQMWRLGDNKAKLHSIHRFAFDSFALFLITGAAISGLVKPGKVLTVSVVCGPVK